MINKIRQSLKHDNIYDMISTIGNNAKNYSSMKYRGTVCQFTIVASTIELKRSRFLIIGQTGSITYDLSDEIWNKLTWKENRS